MASKRSASRRTAHRRSQAAVRLVNGNLNLNYIFSHYTPAEMVEMRRRNIEAREARLLSQA